MNTAQRVSLKIIKNKIKRTLTLLTVLRLSPIAYRKEIRELYDYCNLLWEFRESEVEEGGEVIA